MPPKYTAERLQEKLAKLRVYVTDHSNILLMRLGDTLVQKLRQNISNEERGWYIFLSKYVKTFTVLHSQHLAATYQLIKGTDGTSTRPHGALTKNFRPAVMAGQEHKDLATPRRGTAIARLT